MNHNLHGPTMLRFQSVVITICLLLLPLLHGCAQTQPNAQNSQAAIDSEHSDLHGITKNQKTAELITNGFVQMASNNDSFAKMFFIRALDQTPDSPQAYIGLGEIEYKAGQYTNAYINFKKAADLDQDNITAIIGKAKSQRQQNKLNAAIQEINVALSSAPNDIKVLTELAIIYDLLGKETLSAPIYQEILERAPDQAASSNNIGLNHLSQEKYNLAILAFQRALSLDQKNPRIKNNLATAFALFGDEEMAINIFKETVGESGAYNNVGYLYITQGRLNEAEKVLHKALEANPRFYEKAQENLDRVRQLRQTAKQKQ